jgi:hypothetical protein
VVTQDPQLPYTFEYFAELGAYRGQLTHAIPGFGPTVFDVYDYRLLRPPARVLLTVQTLAGHVATARAGKTVTFTNPDITQQVGYAPAYDWFGPGINAPDWIVNPGPRDGCPALTYRSLFGDTTVKGSVALAALTRSRVVLNRGRSITLQAQCRNPLKSCLALIDVLSTAPKLSHVRISSTRAQRSFPASLGRRAFVVPAGRTVSVSVPLNARGKAMARAHNLHHVALLLGSVGARGKIITTVRTVAVHTS